MTSTYLLRPHMTIAEAEAAIARRKERQSAPVSRLVAPHLVVAQHGAQVALRGPLQQQNEAPRWVVLFAAAIALLLVAVMVVHRASFLSFLLGA